MTKFRSIVGSVLAIAAISTPLVSTSALAQPVAKQNYIGPQVSVLSGGVGVGVTSKLGITDSFAIRPFVTFGSGSGGSGTSYGAAATYALSPAPSASGQQANGFIPYIGLGVVGYTTSASRSTFFGPEDIPGKTNFSGYGELGADYNIGDSSTVNTSVRVGPNFSLSLGFGLQF